MIKEFIPYDQALLLKELGFNDECIQYYAPGHPEGYYLRSRENALNNTHWMFVDDGDGKGRDKLCTAPLYQQAFRWFRETYNLEGEVHCIRFNSKRLKGYQYAITSQNYQKFEQLGNYDTYEEAQLACLKKLIEIVKNR